MLNLEGEVSGCLSFAGLRFRADWPAWLGPEASFIDSSLESKAIIYFLFAILPLGPLNGPKLKGFWPFRSAPGFAKLGSGAFQSTKSVYWLARSA